jgi:hypothetical protein
MRFVGAHPSKNHGSAAFPGQKLPYFSVFGAALACQAALPQGTSYTPLAKTRQSRQISVGSGCYLANVG